ncbi:MAG: hypothetical protein J3K34DRAFT_365890, partial [Monoraphidium minutum]
QDVCWICLGGAEDGELVTPCRCPLVVHAPCLSRWQLRRLSRADGSRCRFCGEGLPAWTSAAPAGGGGGALAVVSIHVAGRIHQVCLPPGAVGEEAFKQQVAEITGTPFDDESCCVSFVCRDPFDPSATVTLEGLSQFDDAMRCALLSARGRACGGGGDAAGARGGCEPGEGGGVGGGGRQRGSGSGSEGGGGSEGIEGYRTEAPWYGFEEGYEGTFFEEEGGQAGRARGGGGSGGSGGGGGVLRALGARGRRAWAKLVVRCLAPAVL